MTEEKDKIVGFPGVIQRQYSEINTLLEQRKRLANADITAAGMDYAIFHLYTQIISVQSATLDTYAGYVGELNERIAILVEEMQKRNLELANMQKNNKMHALLTVPIELKTLKGAIPEAQINEYQGESDFPSAPSPRPVPPATKPQEEKKKLTETKAWLSNISPHIRWALGLQESDSTSQSKTELNHTKEGF
jgi:uncharacterized small protein (DUF1192 family)